MERSAFREFLGKLEKRRKVLKMPYHALARRSGVSRATLFRLLSGEATDAGFSTVAALAETLGVKLVFRPTKIAKVVERQAVRQARRLVGMVQGTMGLEGQAVDAACTDELIEKTSRQLLEGPRKKLWVE